MEHGWAGRWWLAVWHKAMNHLPYPTNKITTNRPSVNSLGHHVGETQQYPLRLWFALGISHKKWSKFAKKGEHTECTAVDKSVGAIWGRSGIVRTPQRAFHTASHLISCDRNVHDMHVVAQHQLIANTPAGINGAIVTSATVSWRRVLPPVLGRDEEFSYFTPAFVGSTF